MGAPWHSRAKPRGGTRDQFLADDIVAFLEDPKQGDLEHQAHASGVELVIGFVSFERHQGHTGAKIRPLPDINFKKAGFRIGFFPARLAQVIDDGQQQLRVVFPLLMVVFDVTAPG